MVTRILLCAAFAVTMFAAPAQAELTAEQEEDLSTWWRTCESRDADPDDVIRNCTSIIESGLDTRENRAVAHSNRGDALREKGEFDRALADHNEAIKLDPYNSALHDNFGRLHADMGDFDRAIAEHSEAVRLNPNDAIAYDNRGFAWQAKGEYERAIADHNEAIKRDPRDSFAYANRGRARLYTGSPIEALADLVQASTLDPKDAHHALWADIVTYRNKAPGRLAQVMSSLDFNRWPAPILRLFLGLGKPDEVFAATDDPVPYFKRTRLCQAHFYTGIWALRQGDKQEATRLLGLAAKECPFAEPSRFAAREELRALGVKP